MERRFCETCDLSSIQSPSNEMLLCPRPRSRSDGWKSRPGSYNTPDSAGHVEAHRTEAWRKPPSPACDVCRNCRNGCFCVNGFQTPTRQSSPLWCRRLSPARNYRGRLGSKPSRAGVGGQTVKDCGFRLFGSGSICPPACLDSQPEVCLHVLACGTIEAWLPSLSSGSNPPSTNGDGRC